MSYTKKELIESLSHVKDDDAIISLLVLTDDGDGSESGFEYEISGVSTSDNFNSLSICAYTGDSKDE